MNDLIVAAWPQEDVLEAGRRELSRLAGQLADQELALTRLRSALSRFEIRHFQTLGRRYVELDALQARLAQARTRRHPIDEGLLRDAWYRHFRAERTARQFHDFAERAPEDPPGNGGLREPDEPARRLYRTLARQIHPDRAENEESRAFRTALMAELNSAYAEGDTGRMQAVLEEWRSSPEAVSGNGSAAESTRLARSIARMKRRLAAIEKELALLEASEMGRLLAAVRSAADRGRDLLADLAAQLDARIAQVRRELAELEEGENR